MTLGIERGSELGDLPTVDAIPVVADGWHNAFAALTAWNGRYWLAYRRGSGHTARDGVIVVSVSSDLLAWEEVTLFKTGADDRDAQWVVFNGRLWLYFNSLRDGMFAIYASQTEDGRTWSEPERVYRDGLFCGSRLNAIAYSMRGRTVREPTPSAAPNSSLLATAWFGVE